MENEQTIPNATQLEAVIATPELNNRPFRAVNLEEERKAYSDLTNSFMSDPNSCLEKVVEVARRLCQADTVGISVEETNAQGEPIFRWVAIAGDLREMVGGTTPRNFSPCGVCVDTNQPLLMDGLDRAYPYFKSAPLPFVEALLLPWGVSNGPTGTLWIVAHSDRRKFDLQDVRIMSSLAAFAFGATYLKRSVQREERSAAASSLMSSLAHHINNPLQAALLTTFLLKEQGRLVPDDLELLSVLESELRRIAAISAELIRENTEPVLGTHE